MAEENAYMIPTSKKEVEALGWDYIDVILFTGDAFVDHPSFGSACIARYLQKAGYRVAVVPFQETGRSASVFWPEQRGNGFHGEPLYRVQTAAAR